MSQSFFIISTSNIMASEENVIAGEQHNTPIITCSVGTFVYRRLLQYDQENIALTNEITTESLTLGELLKRSCQLADAIQNFGITKNDIAAISSENNIHYYIPVMGCIFSGVPITLINPMYTNDELCHSVSIAEPSVMFCSSTTVSNIINLKQRFPCIKAIIVIDGEAPPGAITMTDFIQKYSKIEAISSFTPEEVDLDHTALIMWSSGTTGLPKGVMITHKNVNSKNMMLFDPNYINKFQIKVALGVLPFFHAFGFYSVLTGLLLGKRIIVLPVFNPVQYLECIQKYKIPILAMVPPLANFLAKSPLAEKFDLSHVEEIGVGGGPISKDLQDEIKKKFGVKHIRQGYGLTEVTITLTVAPLGEGKHGSCGKAIPGTFIVIKDLQTGRNLGPNQTGEICCKSDSVMKGYFRNEEATRASFTNDGWLKTGDIGYYDEDDYFYIVDRLKELTKYKGYQVAPAELEKILMGHPKIKDAAVVGLPDERDGEKPMAFVVKEDDVKLSAAEVFNYVRRFVSKNKYLHGGVVFINDIPRSSTGKILRAKVKQMARGLKSKL